MLFHALLAVLALGGFKPTEGECLTPHIFMVAEATLLDPHSDLPLVSQVFNPFPTPPDCGQVGSAELYRSPLGVPGTDLRVCGDWYGHKEDICGRSFNELTVIHTR